MDCGDRHGDGGAGAVDANSLFGGGGFMPSLSKAAPESSSGISKGRSAQTLVPLTVKQIKDAAQTSDDKSYFGVHGVEVSTVRLVRSMVNKIQRVQAAYMLSAG